MSLILNCLHRRFCNLFSTQTLDCQAGENRASHLNEITGLGETNSFKFSGFCIEMEEVVHYPEDSTVCMWRCTRDAAHCHGHSAMNVSHHVKIKCAFNVWGPSTYICRQACVKTHEQTLTVHTEHMYLWRKHSSMAVSCSLFNLQYLPFSFIPVLSPNMVLSSCFVSQRFSHHKPLPFHVFLLPIHQCKTHTHTAHATALDRSVFRDSQIPALPSLWWTSREALLCSGINAVVLFRSIVKHIKVQLHFNGYHHFRLGAALTVLKLHAIPVGGAPSVDLIGDMKFVMHAATFHTIELTLRNSLVNMTLNLTCYYIPKYGKIDQIGEHHNRQACFDIEVCISLSVLPRKTNGSSESKMTPRFLVCWPRVCPRELSFVDISLSEPYNL